MTSNGWREGSKVVRRVGDQLWSVREGDTKVIYARDLETSPPWGCGPLAVFSSLEFALAFREVINTSPALETWRAEFLPDDKNDCLWDLVGAIDLADAPAGTVLARAVKLVERAEAKAEGAK